MPTVRTKCPSCVTVVVDASTMTVRRRKGAARTEAIFVCPDCASMVVQPLSDRMVPVLIGAGCLVEAWEDGSTLTGAISEAEINDFVRELDAVGWMDELVTDW